MATTIVYFKLSELEGINFWSVFLDEIPMSPTGLEYRLVVEEGVEHKIRYVYSGASNGSLKAEVIDHGTVIAKRDKAMIPPGATHSYDTLTFTVAGDGQ